MSFRKSVHSKCLVCTILLITCFSCIEKFEPVESDEVGILVVEGLISDRVESYTIQLSRSRSIGDLMQLPEAAAQVFVSDGDGNEYEFLEKLPGQYQSNSEHFTGKVGSRYRLFIETAGGSRYQSEEVLLKRNPGIDSVYFERESRYHPEKQAMIDGIKLLVDAHDVENNTFFYRYEWVENYEIKVSFAAYMEALNVQTCYGGDTSSQILTVTTLPLEEDRVSEFELKYVSADGHHLRSFYSLLVRQYVLDEKAFRYWDALKQQSEELGTLFDPQPYRLSGNVKGVSNTSEIVIGYFDASAVAEKQYYLSREQLAEVVFPSDGCFGVPVAVGDAEPSGLCMASGTAFGTQPAIYAPCECTDCRLTGTLEKPDFWPR